MTIKNRVHESVKLVCCVVLCLLFTNGIATAATVFNWDDGGGDRNWSTAANWNNDVEPGGAADDWAYFNNGGTGEITSANSELCERLFLGKSNGSTGSVEMTGGKLTVTKYAYIGNSGVGTFTQTGGTNDMHDATMYLAYNSEDLGTYNLSGGRLETHSIFIGRDGNGVFNHFGGTNYTTVGATIANSAGSTGIYYLGNASSSGILDHGTLTIGNNATADGTLHGWGVVTNVGHFYQNGRIIADGYGTDRALYLRYGAFHNDYENTNAVPKGWFAQNNGVLVLPELKANNGGITNNWGEASADADIDLVNSVRFGFPTGSGNHYFNIYLVASDYGGGIPEVPTAVPSLPPNTIGVWYFDIDDFSVSGVELTFRYDDSGTKDPVGLFQYRGTEWVDVSRPASPIDTGNKLVYSAELTTAQLADYPYFAISCGADPDSGTIFKFR